MDNSLIEYYILILSSKDEQFLLKIGEYLYLNDVKGTLKKSYFSSKNEQIIFDLMYYIFNKTNKLPSFKDMEFVLSNIYKDEEQRKTLVDYTHDVFFFEDEINFDLVKEEAFKFVKDRKFIEAFSDSQKDLENKNYDAVIDRLQKSMNINFDSDYGVDIKNWDEVKKALTSIQNGSAEVFPTGYDMLDSDLILNGGCRRAELFCCSASSGVGKSLFLGNLAVNFALNGKKVLYISFETSAARLSARIMSNLINSTTTRISYTMSENSEEIKKDWEESVKNIPGELRIKEFPSGSINCNQVEAFIMDLKKNTGFLPDVLILDYISIMRPNDARISKDNSYVYSGSIAVEMRALAYKLDCVVWTASQLNRSALSGQYNKEGLGADSLSESLTIQQTVDMLMFLTHNKKEAEENKLSAFVVKNRNGQKGTMTLEIQDSCRMVEIKGKK